MLLQVNQTDMSKLPYLKNVSGEIYDINLFISINMDKKVKFFQHFNI